MRINRQSQKVKVYGVNSTKDVRARLIEILFERVKYHKDKFVAPILHQEMQGMETKRNGKVEHSDKSHDDQVFSYLMALYVWYEGKNLAENFHIMKNTLRTDADIEIDEAGIEDQLEKKERIDPNKLLFEDDDKVKDLNDTLEWVEHDAKSFVTTRDLEDKQNQELFMLRQKILTENPELRERIIEETGVDSVNYINAGTPYINLPNAIFGYSDEEMDFDVEDLDAYMQNPQSHITGNLADMFKNL